MSGRLPILMMALAGLPSAAVTQQPSPATWIARQREYLSRAAEWGFSGAVLVEHGGRVVVRDSIERLAAQSDSLWRAAWSGESALLARVASASRAERYRVALADWRRQRSDSLGSLRGIEILGSVRLAVASGGWLIYADLSFERGTERVALGWRSTGELVQLITQNPPLANWSEQFFATGEGEYTAHDLISETTVLARCDADESGARWDLTSGRSRWVAKRTP